MKKIILLFINIIVYLLITNTMINAQTNSISDVYYLKINDFKYQIIYSISNLSHDDGKYYVNDQIKYDFEVKSMPNNDTHQYQSFTSQGALGLGDLTFNINHDTKCYIKSKTSFSLDNIKFNPTNLEELHAKKSSIAYIISSFNRTNNHKISNNNINQTDQIVFNSYLFNIVKAKNFKYSETNKILACQNNSNIKEEIYLKVNNTIIFNGNPHDLKIKIINNTIKPKSLKIEALGMINDFNPKVLKVSYPDSLLNKQLSYQLYRNNDLIGSYSNIEPIMPKKDGNYALIYDNGLNKKIKLLFKIDKTPPQISINLAKIYNPQSHDMVISIKDN
ncbi:MAG: hypothetical protein LBT75_01650 [Bacilli bacterium]|jgi:hypothetical protein|nr:hypothetical protein [Bacilli bacterium]